MQEKNFMLIGELAQTTGLSKDTLRFYQKLGLIDAQARQAGSRIYMEFGPAMVERIALITKGKTLGFTLSEIKHLIDTWGSQTMPSAEKLAVIDRKLDEIAEKMRQLEEIKTYLGTKRNQALREANIS